MICNKCGNKVNDNDIYCPVCSAKLEKKKEHNLFTDLRIRFNLARVRFFRFIIKFIACAFLISIAVCCVFVFINTDARCFVANILAENGHYHAACIISSSINNEKLAAKKDYYALMEMVSDFVSSQPKFNYDLEWQKNGVVITDKEIKNEIKNALWNNPDDIKYCNLDDYTAIELKANEVINISQYLSEREKTNLDKINSCIIDFKNNTDCNDFNDYLNRAYEIYTVCESLNQGKSYDISAILYKLEHFESELNSADFIFNTYLEYDPKLKSFSNEKCSFYGFCSMNDNISILKELIREEDEKYGYTNRIRRNSFSYEPSPYVNGRDNIAALTKDLKLIIIKSEFDQRCSSL